MNNQNIIFKNETLFDKVVLMMVKHHPDIDTTYDVDSMFHSKYLKEETWTVKITENDVIVYNDVPTKTLTLYHNVTEHNRVYVWTKTENSNFEDVKMIILALSNPGQFDKLMKEQDELKEAMRKLNYKYLNLYTSTALPYFMKYKTRQAEHNTNGVMFYVINDKTPIYKYAHLVEHHMKADAFNFLRKAGNRTI